MDQPVASQIGLEGPMARHVAQLRRNGKKATMAQIRTAQMGRIRVSSLQPNSRLDRSYPAQLLSSRTYRLTSDRISPSALLVDFLGSGDRRRASQVTDLPSLPAS
jgi:hypothetical protein